MGGKTLYVLNANQISAATVIESIDLGNVEADDGTKRVPPAVHSNRTLSDGHIVVIRGH
jgi:hypothetical protein